MLRNYKKISNIQYLISNILVSVIFFVIPVQFTISNIQYLNIPNVSAATISAGLDRGLVGRWTMDNADVSGTTVKDKTRNKYHGTITGGVTASAGKLGEGRNFNGTTGYISVANNNSLNFGTGPFSVSMWVKASSLTLNEDGVFSKDSYTGASTYAGFVINVRTDLKWSFETRDISGGSGPDTSVFSASPATTAWTHLVAVRDGTSPASLRIYVNGVLSNSNTETGATNVNNSVAATIGVLNINALNQYFDGIIDDVRIYNRALSAREVKQLYGLRSVNRLGGSPNPTNTSIKNGLVGWWTFDAPDVNATQVLDKSAQGNTGTRNGGLATVQGKIGQGMRFDGVDDTATYQGTVITAYPFSVSLWFKQKSDATQTIWSMSPNSASLAGYAGIITIAGRTIRAQIDTGDGSASIAETTAKWTVNEWSHAVAVFTSATSRTIYLNGGNAITNTASENFLTNTPAITMVGALAPYQPNAGNTLPYKGDVDDVRIYNRALSAKEIKQLYQAGAGNKTSGSPNPANTLINRGLVGYWTFDGKDVNATQALDKSGNGNTGIRDAVNSSIGKLGQAFRFTSSSVDLFANKSNFSGLSSGTVSGWFKNYVKPGSGFEQSLIGYGDKDTTLDLFFIDTTAGGRVRVVARDSGNILDMQTPVADVMATGTWYHFAYTTGAGGNSFYINGIKQSMTYGVGSESTQAFFSTPQSANTDYFYIGNMKFTSGSLYTRLFNGLIDDVRVYNRALSAAEVYQLYVMGR